jgi:hypothetical protein
VACDPDGVQRALWAVADAVNDTDDSKKNALFYGFTVVKTVAINPIKSSDIWKK